MVKKIFREIDLFDFTSFFGLDFLNFLACCESVGHSGRGLKFEKSSILTLNVFEFFQMEEDDTDLLEPSQNEDMDAFVENDNGTDDLDEDEIITEEKLNEEDDTASN